MWQLHSVSLKLASPLHVGLGFRGNLKHTRAYIGGRALWGALASRIARDYLGDNYKSAEQWVHDNLRFSYLYPSTSPDRVTAFPWQAPADFRWQFLHSYASTALVDGRAKLDGSLHETEYIGPRTRDKDHVWMNGYLWTHKDAELSGKPFSSVRDRIFSRINIGAERSYGWGRFSQAVFRPLPAASAVFEGWVWDSSTMDEVVLVPAGSARLFAHLQIPEGDKNFPSAIELEPVVGLLTDSTGWGRLPSQAVIAVPPGTFLHPVRRCRIGNFGIWSVCLEV